MSLLHQMWLRLLGRDRSTLGNVAFADYFCTDCPHANCDRCAIKNRRVREVSAACSAFTPNPERNPHA